MNITLRSVAESRRVGMKGSKLSKFVMPLGALFVLACAGCMNLIDEFPSPPPTNPPPPQPIDTNVVAGVQATTGPPQLVGALIQKRAAAQVFQPPLDPFRLREFETSYDIKQSNMRIVEQISGGPFPALYVVEPETVEVQLIEPQPYRRLAGIIVGDSVMAIIDMGDGRPTQIIRPGQQIPNSPWRVVSIDETKAVLRRTGNRLPTEVVVRLENPPPVRGPVIQPPAAGGNRQPGRPQPGNNPNAPRGAGDAGIG